MVTSGSQSSTGNPYRKAIAFLFPDHPGYLARNVVAKISMTSRPGLGNPERSRVSGQPIFKKIYFPLDSQFYFSYIVCHGKQCFLFGVLMTSEHELSTSLQSYLETIHGLCLKNRVARVNDIAKRMDVHKTSVTNALRELSGKNLINYSPYQYITLTEEGERQAKVLMKKHKIIQDFFEQVLLIPPKIAEKEACTLEHILGDNVLERFQKFIQFQRSHCEGGLSWTSDNRFICPTDQEKNNFHS